MKERVSIISVTLNRHSLKEACESVNIQTFKDWHHYVIGDGVLPQDYLHQQRSSFGFSRALGAEEPGANMPDGTPNPLQRWALKKLDLGEYVCFLDDDNQYSPTFLMEMIQSLEKHLDKGVALCAVDDRRHGQVIDGFPMYPRCDNSGAMYRMEVAKTIEFPHASMDKNVIQDCEYIECCAAKFGWVQVPLKLVTFGNAPNFPPSRGGLKLLESWEIPIKAQEKIQQGNIYDGIIQLEEIVKHDRLDAWSIWSLAEGYILLGETNKCYETLRKWKTLVIEYDTFKNQHWILFCFGICQSLLDGGNLSTFALKSLEHAKAQKANDQGSLYIAYSCALYKVFSLKNTDSITINEYKSILRKDKSRTFYFKNAFWKLTILSKLFPHMLVLSTLISIFNENE